jgi:hypothetical protein
MVMDTVGNGSRCWTCGVGITDMFVVAAGDTALLGGELTRGPALPKVERTGKSLEKRAARRAEKVVEKCSIGIAPCSSGGSTTCSVFVLFSSSSLHLINNEICRHCSRSRSHYALAPPVTALAVVIPSTIISISL